MNNTIPITEEVNQVAKETGAQVENVTEGIISKEKMDSMGEALNCGARMIVKTLEMEGVKLTKEQEDTVLKAYHASFAISALLMK